MADSNNPGQFGNRDDTSQQAAKGGAMSGDSNRKDPQQMDPDTQMDGQTQSTDYPMEESGQ
jgi:hypothetical protein